MKTTTALCVAIAAAVFAGPASAIFKCTTAKGVVYQDRPCREGAESDVLIVVPTGEIAPRAAPAADESAASNGTRTDDRANAQRAPRNSAEPSASVSRPAERRGSDAAASGADTTRRSAMPPTETTTPLTPEQAKKTDPSAKYYATEAFGAGGETPSQMNCESPTGEKRIFYLSNGKLTSI
jgi:hypothetical protein